MFKTIKLIAVISLFACSANAQSFKWGKMEEPVKLYSFIADSVTVDPVPTEQNIFGPVANIVSYGAFDNSLLVGAGIGYKHMKWDSMKKEWVEVWSINALAWNKASLAAQKNAFAYGIAAGFGLGNFYGRGLIGFATTDIRDISDYFPTIGLTLPINR